MRNKTHTDQITRWALFVKNNPNKWKKVHTEFIDAQFEKSKRFYNALSKTKKGKAKIISLFNIKNLKAYPSLK